jgi:ribosomal 50S subunit-associated protein YjgA (DUF615 family)
MLKHYPDQIGPYGIPTWFHVALNRFAKSKSETARRRILTRVSRLMRVVDGRRRSLSIGRQMHWDHLKQNPGEFENLDWPD